MEEDKAYTPLIERYGAFVIDLDGVVYLQNEPIPGSTQTIRYMQDAGTPFVFLTNNSVATPEMYAERLRDQDIFVRADQIVTSCQAARVFLERNFETEGKSVFVIGEKGLLVELEGLGLKILNAGRSAGADFVLIGGDTHFDYEKLKAAVIAIRAGAVYVATNVDATYPTPHGLWPGAGTIVAAVSTGAGSEPVVVGKPNPLFVNLALERMSVSPSETLLIGDRLESDIEAGIAAGVDTLLVLSGVSTEEDINRLRVRPTHVRNRLSCLLD